MFQSYLESCSVKAKERNIQIHWTGIFQLSTLTNKLDWLSFQRSLMKLSEEERKEEKKQKKVKMENNRKERKNKRKKKKRRMIKKQIVMICLVMMILLLQHQLLNQKSKSKRKKSQLLSQSLCSTWKSMRKQLIWTNFSRKLNKSLLMV